MCNQYKNVSIRFIDPCHELDKINNESNLKRVKQLKSKIIDDTNREMQLFKKFQEYSKSHTGVTYEEFLKNNI